MFFKPRYAKSNKKFKYARKRQARTVSQSRSLYTNYSAPRALSQTTSHAVRRMFNFGSAVSSASFTDGLAYFQLQALPDYAEFTALYDQYQINKIVVHFIPNATNIDHSSSTLDSGTLLTAVDFDGGATGLTLSQFMSYESCQVHPHCRPAKITVKPRAETAAIDGTGTTISAVLPNNGNIWYDCSNTQVRFHGVRYATTAETSVSGYHANYNIWVECYVTFKATR